MNEWKEQWVNECMIKLIIEWKEELINAWVSEWMNENN